MEEKNINVENVNNNINQENNDKKIEKSNKKRKRNGVVRFISNTLSFLLFISVIGLTVLAFMGFNSVKNEQEPKFYFDKNTYTSDGKNITSYNFWLYRAEKIEDSKKYSYRLVPFFIK